MKDINEQTIEEINERIAYLKDQLSYPVRTEDKFIETIPDWKLRIEGDMLEYMR